MKGVRRRLVDSHPKKGKTKTTGREVCKVDSPDESAVLGLGGMSVVGAVHTQSSELGFDGCNNGRVKRLL